MSEIWPQNGTTAGLIDDRRWTESDDGRTTDGWIMDWQWMDDGHLIHDNSSRVNQFIRNVWSFPMDLSISHTY